MRTYLKSVLTTILILILPNFVQLAENYLEPIKYTLCVPVDNQVKIDSVLNSSIKHAEYINSIIDLCMDRPIPASIKVAQAILETGGGTNTLSRHANNHFSVKAGSYWQGKITKLKDDKYVDGILVPSDFRVYSSKMTSFFDHERLITTSKRYRSLLEIHHTDYKAWAYGLKRQGYATDPAYATKLIYIIQKNKLFLLDQELFEERELITWKLKDEITKSFAKY
jgi:flagellum-specific peptidoglycan hydrolase FlgJ